MPRTLWKKEDVGSNRTSKNEMRDLFPGVESFDTPKPTRLIERTVANFATVQTEGGREVSRETDHFNLDVIISVGYRVKSHRGTQFRIWATWRPPECIEFDITWTPAGGIESYSVAPKVGTRVRLVCGDIARDGVISKMNPDGTFEVTFKGSPTETRKQFDAPVCPICGEDGPFESQGLCSKGHQQQ